MNLGCRFFIRPSIKILIEANNVNISGIKLIMPFIYNPALIIIDSDKCSKPGVETQSRDSDIPQNISPSRLKYLK
ncbi:MAG: hypothetical protein CM15mP93_11500 [Thiotrichaceae bacterium]|nr:MAG: hypothetical protein CM15mP93_11500 [Thiotrichaceae bacterium]